MMSQVEEKRLMVVSSLTIPSVESQMPQGGGGEGRVHRRRRKKAQGELTSEAEAKKRRLSDEQTRYLEMNFVKERRLESSRKVHLAAEAGLEPKQVAVWFQNRRARWKNKQMEEDFLRLKSAHDAAVAQKCSLEDEVSKLQERLSEAEEEIRKLSEGTNRASGGGERGRGSPSSSPSINTNEQFMGEVWMGGADLMYIQDDCYNFLMEYCEFL